MRIVVMGDVMLDVYEHMKVTRISPEAPVPVGVWDSTEYKLGGAANVAHNIKVLCPEAEVVLIGEVGEDAAMDRMRDLCQRAGIAYFLVPGRTSTITKTRYVDISGQQLLRVDQEGVLNHPTWHNTHIDQVETADVVVVADYDKGFSWWNSTPDQRWLVNAKPARMTRYQGAGVQTMNASEMQEFVKRSALCPDELSVPGQAVHVFCALNVNTVVVTCGSEGIVATDGDKMVYEAALSVPVADVSGAGDTVLATLAVAKALGHKDLQATIRWAIRNAASVVSQRGTSVPVVG